MLKIWGRLSSINVQKVVWCARALGLDFERVDAGGAFGVVDAPSFRLLNPNGKVPVIEDDGLVLWESNAILRYLCARHAGAGLCPEDRGEIARCDQWMDWQATELTPAMRVAFIQLVRTPPADRQQSLIDESLEQTESLVGVLDVALAARSFIVGDRFTMADIPLACALHRWYAMPVVRRGRPGLESWLERCRAQAGAREALVPLS